MDEHIKAVADVLNGKKTPDEGTLEAMMVLKDRLARLKSQSMMFADVSFSPDVKKLKNNVRRLVHC